MKPKFILMLTYNDQTVENALELFEENWDTPVTHWGFKDVGLPKSKMKKVIEAMKAIGASNEDGAKTSDMIAAKCPLAKGLVNNILTQLANKKVVKRVAKSKAAVYFIAQQV